MIAPGTSCGGDYDRSVPDPPLTPLATAVLCVGAPERVLALECDEGDAALFLAREFPRARVRGVDRSEGGVRRASARVGLDPEGRVAFKQGRPSALPFPDSQFDLLACVDVRPGAAEAARVLRPGGHLVLAYTSRSQAPGGAAGWLLRRRLARAGFEPLETAGAGEGSFAVSRLTGGPGDV
jgi:ubiquinone/menaquinone biosynthesis C-methylase UbiE